MARNRAAPSRSTWWRTTLSTPRMTVCRSTEVHDGSSPTAASSTAIRGTGCLRSWTAWRSASLPTPGSPTTASHSRERKWCSTSWHACVQTGTAPTRPGSGRGPPDPVVRWAGTRIAWRTTRTTSPDGRPGSPTACMCIRAVPPPGRSTSWVPRRPVASASLAWVSRLACSAADSTVRACSLSIPTSAFTASTIPEDRRQIRRYSSSSSRSWTLLAFSSAVCTCWAVVLARASRSVPASRRQQVRSTSADGATGERVLDRHPGAGEVLEALGVVLVPEHVRGGTHLERRTDAVGADRVLRVVEAGRQADPVQPVLQRRVAGEPGEDQAVPVGEHDADRLAGHDRQQAVAAPGRRPGTGRCPGRG